MYKGQILNLPGSILNRRLIMSFGRMFSIFRISGSGLFAQRALIEATSQNIANLETTRTKDGSPYVPRRVRFQASQGRRGRFGSLLMTELSRRNGTDLIRGTGPVDVLRKRAANSEFAVDAQQVKQQKEPFKLVYEPDNPDADENGYVKKPNINLVQEMSNLMIASRTYEANISVMNGAKAMMKKALEI